jgi:hypothetical protein
MPLHFAGINVDKISGPIAIYYLKPTDTFKTFTTDENICDMFLLGDKHYSTDGQTTFDEKRGSATFGLMSTGWYKLLDTISTPQHPIDYYIESFYPPLLLQESDHILKNQRISFQSIHNRSTFTMFY